MSLCVLTTAASAPAVMASTGSSGQKRRCGPHAWSVTNGMPARCASSPIAGRSAPRPLYVGEVTNSAQASGACARAVRASAAAHLQRDAPERVDGRLHVQWHGAGEDEPRKQRLVGVAGHDHRLAGTAQREQQGVHPAAGAVDQEPGAVGAPRLGGVVLGQPDEPGGLTRVLHAPGHGEIHSQRLVAHELAQARRRTLAQLVARGVERRVVRGAVAQRGVQVRCLPLVVGHSVLPSRRQAGGLPLHGRKHTKAG